jgi:hypothetical protein
MYIYIKDIYIIFICFINQKKYFTLSSGFLLTLGTFILEIFFDINPEYKTRRKV